MVSSNPVDNATGVAVTVSPTVTFSEELAASKVNADNVFLLDAGDSPVAGTVSLSTDRKVITFDPTANLTATTMYRLIITTAITDLAGNKLAAPVVISFTTA